MKTLEMLQAELTTKQEELSEVQGNLESISNDPLSYFDEEITSQYNDMLNESYGELVDALPFYVGSASDLIEDKDNTFYRCGLNDFADGFDVSHFDEWIELESTIEDLENQISDIESEIEDLESEDDED